MITLLAIKTALKKVWAWICNNGGYVLLLCLGAFTGAALLRRKDSQIQDVTSALKIERSKAAIENLRVQKDEVIRRDKATGQRSAELAKEAQLIEQRIQEEKKKVAAAHSGKHVFTLSDEEVEKHFREAGL